MEPTELTEPNQPEDLTSGNTLPEEQPPELTPELTPTKESVETLAEVTQSAKAAILEVKKIEVEAMGEVLTHLSGLADRLETLTGDLFQSLEEVGEMKAELAEAIAETQAERQAQAAITEVVKEEAKQEIPERKKMRLW